MVVAIAFASWWPADGHAADDDVESVVAATVRPLMRRLAIPGMAVGVVVDRRRHVFHFGVASKATGAPVDDATLFEVGSVSKTFTATLAAYAEITGRLSLSDPVSLHLPALRGSAFDAVTLKNLGTHTAGDLSQVFDGAIDDAGVMRRLRRWRPAADPGTTRSYGNAGIGLLGMATAASLHGDFVALMQGSLFPALGLRSTFVEIPRERMRDYAQGYTDTDAPVRMGRGPFAAEAYGVRTTADDLLRFVEANLGSRDVDDRWRRAVVATHAGYYRLGAMTQDLVWEQYVEPATLSDLLAGKSAGVVSGPNPVDALDPPSTPRDDVLIDKTGSTNGFSTYVLFVPARRVGIVLLANKRVPIEDRVTAAFELLDRLSGPAAQSRSSSR